MIPVFADTALYVALANRKDAIHERALAFFSSFTGELLTTDFVLLEVANFHSRSALRRPFLNLYDRITSDPSTEIVRVDSDLFDQGMELFSERDDKDWSLTDCISFVVMKQRELSEALTSDHHFEQAGFRALLLDQTT